jgi:hypothetical protein
MVTLRDGHVGSMPIGDASLQARVDPVGELVRCARSVGIELGAPPAEG